MSASVSSAPGAGNTPIVLAYSGGLDTSFLVPWIAEVHRRLVGAQVAVLLGIDAHVALEGPVAVGEVEPAGVRVVGLYAATSATLVGPRGGEATIIQKPRTCDPCLEKNCPYTPRNCMDQIGVAEVWAALEPALAA